MKYSLLCYGVMGVTLIAFPSYAQFSSFSANSDNCANVCLKFDVGSANSIDSVGFNGSAGSSNLRWQASITWRPNAPEVVQAEAERIKQRLEENKTLITTLAEAIAQNKPELARGIAIILAPRLNYPDPKVLIAELKEGTINLGNTPIAVLAPSAIAIQKTAINGNASNIGTLANSAQTTPNIIELQ